MLLRAALTLMIVAAMHASLYSQSDVTGGGGYPYNTELGLSGSFTSMPGESA